MKLSELIDKTIAVIPPRVGNTQLIKELTKLKGWIYPALSTEDIALVVRCKKCKYYKKYRRKNDIKTPSFYACSLTHAKKDPNYYCADGEEKG